MKLSDILQNIDTATDVAAFNKILNQTPPREWLDVHKGVVFQPVSRVKASLLIIFGTYNWEITRVEQMLNAILITGTLTTTHPITKEKWSVSGVGAWPLQLTQGSKPLQFENIIQDAIQKNAPAAESLALKNAANKYGNIFGDGQKEMVYESPFGAEAPAPAVEARVPEEGNHTYEPKRDSPADNDAIEYRKSTIRNRFLS